MLSRARISALTSIAGLTPVSVLAQQAAGSAVADQLAQSSLRMIGSMAAVLALVCVCAWLLRRWRDRPGAHNGPIEIVSGITLGSKERIVLLQIGDEQVLVGVSPAGMRSLHVVRQAAHQAAQPADETIPTEFRLSLGAAQ